MFGDRCRGEKMPGSFLRQASSTPPREVTRHQNSWCRAASPVAEGNGALRGAGFEPDRVQLAHEWNIVIAGTWQQERQAERLPRTADSGKFAHIVGRERIASIQLGTNSAL